MQRILIAGQSGSGKSTLACMLAVGLNLPWHTGDQIMRRPDATLCTQAEFQQQLQATIAKPGWIMDGTDVTKDPQSIARADTFIWLDYSTPLTAFRFASRSLARLCDGETMLGEPRPPGQSFKAIAKDVYWASRAFIERQSRLREQYTQLFEDPAAAPHMQKVRLTSPAQTEAFLQSLGIASSPTETQKHNARRTLPVTPG